MRHAIRMAFLITFFLFILCGSKSHLPPIAIHPNGHFLASNGKPFFLLGDVARTLLTRLDDNELTSFFQDRREKGYNVILTMLAPDPSKADRGGRRPFTDNDPLKLNEAYFSHVSRCIEQAGNKNLYVCLVLGGPVLDGPIFKRISTPEKSYDYGYRIAARLKKNSNLIWALGQDCSGKEIDLWRAMAEGITDALSGIGKFDGNSENDIACLTFYPPMGFSSSYWLQSEAWLDFNLFRPEPARDGQSSADSLAWRNWNRYPVKPAIHIEGRIDDKGSALTDRAIESIYRSVFAGGCGIGLDSRLAEGANFKSVLTLPESESLHHLKNLMLSRPYFSRIPDQGMVEMDLASMPSATRDSTGHYAFIYFNGPGKRQTAMTGRLSGSQLRAWWFSPMDGKIHDDEGLLSKRPFALIEKKDWAFTSPATGRDWVLVLDDASFSFPAPGETMNENGMQ